MSAPSHTPRAIDYTVAWISAIVKEYTIACALLDEEHDTPIDISGDYSAYTFGRMGQHLVVLACLPLATYGTSQASRTVTEIQRTFPSLKIGLMVGIAGGAPLPGHDIRLGDVVVSEPDPRRRCGGVMHYTSGRTVQDIDFEPTSTLNTPDSILLSAAAKLKSFHERRGHLITKTIDQVIEKCSPRLDTYKRPEASVDVLYTSQFTHADERVHCDISCQLSEIHKVARPERDAGEHQPVIHYGLIGSADVLMRDAIKRDEIAQRDGVLCFEMESAGLMSSELRCLVIRGICDYSDTHKNDDWQKYAAAVAAAYAKELLGVIPKHQVRLQDQQLQMWRSLIPNAKPTVLKVLRYDNMNDKHQYATPGLSYDHQWIWSTSFNYWLSSSDEPYWICGKPGSGKSTLMAYLVHNKKTILKLKEHGERFKILHFFYDCKAGSGLANNIHGMLRMFLYQLADQYPQIKSRLQMLLDEGRLTLNTPDELMELVCDALKMPDARFCVFIDGLDEYEGDLIDLMQTCKLLKDLTGIKLCFGSRPEARISEVFNLYAKIMMQDHNSASMYGYASNQLLKLSTTKPDIVSSFPVALQNELVDRAEGILLWFKLAFDDATKHYHTKITIEEMRGFIKSIPRGLDAIYESILDKIPQEYSHEAALLLYLVQQLRDLNQSIHDLSSLDQLSTIVFSATDMDHVWGAYDFMFELIGNESGLQRVSNPSALQSRIKFLLSGLIEVYEVKPEEALTSNTSNLDVRYVHKTLYAFLQTTNWMSANLHDCIKERLPEPFWLCFLTEMIVQSTKDQLLTLDDVEDAKKDTIAFKGLIDTSGISKSTTAAHLIKVVSQRHSTLLALYKAFGTYGPPGEPHFLESVFQSLLDNFSSNYAFSPKWEARHVILRTAFLNLTDLACQYESGEKSSFTFIYRAMQSYLNVIPAFHLLMIATTLQQDLLVSWIRQPELNGILDLVVAITQDLNGYFEDRMFQELPATIQEREFLVHTVVVHCFDHSKKRDLNRFAQTLAANKCFLSVSDVCFFFDNAPDSFMAAYHAADLVAMIPPNLEQLQGEHCQCRHLSINVGLLYHWARFACVNYADVRDLEESTAHHLILLDFLLKFGLDINVNCYSNGTVLHAILDDSIRPLPGRQRLQLKAKFIALTRRGINPRVKGTNGLNALETAKALKVKQSRWSFVPWFAPDLAELNSVIESLEFYELHERWPSDYGSDSESVSTPILRDDLWETDLALIDPEPELEFERFSLTDIEVSIIAADQPEAIHQVDAENIEDHDRDDDYNNGDHDDAQDSSDDEFFNAEDVPAISHHMQEQPLHKEGGESSSVIEDVKPSRPASSLELMSNGNLSADEIAEASIAQGKANTSEVSSQNSTQLENIWYAQALHFSTDMRLFPKSMHGKLLPHQTDTWMFVFQTLQTLGLRMTPEVDSYITCVLQACEFQNVRFALIKVLEIYNRQDLLTELDDLERTRFSPLLASTTPVEEEDSKGKSRQQGEVLEHDLAEDQPRIILSPSPCLQTDFAQPVDTIQPEGLGIDDLKSDHLIGSESSPITSPQPSTYSDINSPEMPSWSFNDNDISQIAIQDHPGMTKRASPIPTVELPAINLGIEPGLLAHRKLIDPCKRPNLKVDPVVDSNANGTNNVLASRSKAVSPLPTTASARARQKAKHSAEKTHYDYVLLSDFRWTIIEHLGYGHDRAPSRQMAEQFLVEADWDFDRAVARYVDSISKV